MTGPGALAHDASVSGVGLFTGRPATVTIRPAIGGEGVSFIVGGERISATIDHLATRPLVPAFEKFPPRHTCLAGQDPRAIVATIEHAMSALMGLGITDASIECDGPEIPICDGSSLPFVEAIARVAAFNLAARSGAEEYTLARTIRVEEGDAWIEVHPRTAPGRSFTYTLEYPAPSPIPPQRATWDGTPEMYARAIAPARTYCLEQEARAMQALGLFTHLTPRDMLVLGPSGPIDNALRFPDEPARHKLLDLIGDLALATGARPLRADVVACRSGHALAHRAARLVAEALRD